MTGVNKWYQTIAILDAARVPLSWVVGGEDVLLVIRCYIIDDLQNPIIGFMFKDRLGKYVFADNTFLTFVDKPVTVAADQLLEAHFNFRMPVMPVGDYSISVAIAEGTQEEHIQHQWINDALIFKVHSSSVCLGLIGVPMKEIELVIKK